ncbi:hypothetical protein UFOVP781_43 [uncultured Caudovirales phage]|uniref:Uncharacterized protein n=1 Tax=uncultured Caudovirales phage TaxID=2100421 RepID=A0A6J5NRL5_9CAUD|nr:hypothetical protein UFOVP279_20 [uncultured Caudovirales phage]CAB4162420.1 hypothetical protein UFOVP781_43 [uncultured Caudovirales phage]
MAFPIIPKKRSGATGNPSSLSLGELAVNTLTSELFLGADGGITLLNGPVAAGTTVTEYPGDGSTTAFTFSGYNGTADGGYLVSVGGIDQPPSKYSVSATAGGTLTFVEAPVAGELISIRAIVAGSGGGGDGNAIKIQGRDVAATAPTAGQVLSWNANTSKWEPTSLNGSVSFNTPGTHLWAVPAWVRWVYVNAAAGTGSDGTATDGQSGNQGAIAYFDENQNPVAATTGTNGADGTASDGIAGKSITVSSLSLNYAGGSAGVAGMPGYGGGGGGGAGISDYRGNIDAANGSAGNGPNPGQGGTGASILFPTAAGGAGGGDGGAGADSNNGGFGGSAGPNFGGAGGGGGQGQYYGGGGGGGDNHSGGGGGGGGINGTYAAGAPGSGGKASPSTLGGNGESFVGPKDLSSVAGTIISIVISEGAGNASITITY